MMDIWASQDKDAQGRVEIVLGKSDDLMKLTLAVMGEAIFGKEMNMFRERSTFCDNLMVVNASIVVPLVFPGPLRNLPYVRQIMKAFDYVGDEIIAMLRSTKEQERDDEEEKRDLLHLIAKATKKTTPLTEGECMSNVWVLLLAGMETTAHTISWALTRLAHNPIVQQRLYEESCQFENGTFEDLTPENAPYTYAVAYEVLRIDSPIFYTPLSCLQDCVVDGIPFEKGWSTHPFFWGSHLNPRTFPEPHKFKPDRMLQDGVFVRPQAISAFSLGPRACLGRNVALHELTIAIAMIANRFEIFPTKPQEEMHWIWKITREFKFTVPFKLNERSK